MDEKRIRELLEDFRSKDIIDEERYKNYLRLLEEGKLEDVMNDLTNFLDEELNRVDLEIIEVSSQIGADIGRLGEITNDEELKKASQEYFTEVNNALQDYNEELDEVSALYGSLRPEIEELKRITEE